ncbi:hypothetical protein JTE90_025158 [Oedothorax gibbosus]|uniref:Peripheral subunit-binding (PSBD) domain-containing protein n=1 Tax=Oedothorax gibbosus TaxID=931172 RepID=A0AAV6UGW1_9ARAC|nr:hypothetical protein JTE90_025158 [Oedothorax gibbosus]
MIPIRGKSRLCTQLFLKQLSSDSFAFLHTTRIRAQELGTHNVEFLFPRLCGPSVKKLLEEYNIEVSKVPNSGPRGNVLKGDVLSYIKDQKLSFAPSKKHADASKKVVIKKGKTHDDLEMSPSKKTTAQQSVLSKNTIPHAYMNVECNIDKVYEYQERMKKDGFDSPLISFIVKCAAAAARKVPQMNITKHNGQVRSLNSVNIALNKAGNTTTVVKKADTLTVQLISEEISKLVEATDVSMRIYDLGDSGIAEFKAVITPPEVAVLAVGSARCVFEDSDFRQKVRITLSFNNEVISSEIAGSFIGYFKEHLENPVTVCLP